MSRLISEFGVRMSERRKATPIRNPPRPASRERRPPRPSLPAGRGGGRATREARFSTTRNAAILREAQRWLVGGVNSPVRAFRHVGGDQLMLMEAHGATVIDSRGRSYVDFIMGWGALILGHNHSAVLRRLKQGADGGMLPGITHPAEIELARRIAQAVPSVEQVRFTVSGTEACMTAIRLARAVTARAKLLVFSGCYHGHGDSVMVGKSAGLPEAVAAQTLTAPFNDSEAAEELVQRHGREIACVIVEPVAANMGVVLPQPGFLERLRQVTARHGILLIFDEVVTGFRLAPGGAQERFGVAPDLITFGKIIGGGMPIGAIGGPRRLMQRLTPEGDVFHGGTFAGHPLSMTVGAAALEELRAHPPYHRLEQLSARAGEGLAAAAERTGIPIQVNRVGSLLTVFFADTPVRNWAEAGACHRERFAQWANALRAQGILVPPSPFEALFFSTAHTDRHVEQLISASAGAFQSMRQPARWR